MTTPASSRSTLDREDAVNAGDSDISMRWTGRPSASAVTAASSATGWSEVPAETTNTPRSSGSGSADRKNGQLGRPRDARAPGSARRGCRGCSSGTRVASTGTGRCFQQAFRRSRRLGRRGLSLRVDRLGHALAELAVGVQPSESEVLDGKLPELAERLIDRVAALADAF